MEYEINYDSFFKSMPFDVAVDYSIKFATEEICKQIDETNLLSWQMKMMMKFGILPIGFETKNLFRV